MSLVQALNIFRALTNHLGMKREKDENMAGDKIRPLVTLVILKLDD